MSQSYVKSLIGDSRFWLSLEHPLDHHLRGWDSTTEMVLDDRRNLAIRQPNMHNDATTSSRELTNQWCSTTTKHQACTYPVPRAIHERRFYT